jgi:hypothetical protein
MRLRVFATNRSFVRTFCCGLLSVAISATLLQAQMVSPTIDSSPGPFSYFSKPTDELSVMGANSGAEISPEGFVYTGFGELMFFLGPEQTPLAARVRTLEDGSLPVYHYSVDHLGIRYSFTVFATRLGDAEHGPVVNFVRVTATNNGSTQRAAFLTSAMRYQAEQTTDMPTGDNRFKRPTAYTGVGQFYQPGEPFSDAWTYACEHGAFVRGGRVLYRYPQQPEPHLSLTLRTHYNRIHPLATTTLDLQPTTPAGAAAYTFVLAPHTSRTLDFVVPLLPVEPGSAADRQLQAASFDAEHTAIVRTWRQVLDRGMQIELPEPKVVDTFRASLVYDLMALNEVDGQPVQAVNQFQYHRFYLRDASDFVRMYDATGYSDIAAKVLSFFPSRQQPDGNFLSQPGQYDGWGEALIAMGSHYRETGDLAFARTVFPSVQRAVAWLIQARARDPLHVMPQSDVRDNEYVAAHLTGYNFLALDGLQSAIELAIATGHNDEAEAFRRERDDYRSVFFKLLDAAVAKNHGALPPALDAQGWGGTDWGNLLAVTPMHVLDPMDLRVTATLARSQARYQEGITTYSEPDDGVFLHHYLTIKNTLTELERDDGADQEQAIRELYAELLHTSSTHAGFEYAIRPWGSRDFEGNLAPHGWFASDYRMLLRNMMVREEGDTLHLLSDVSPQWIGAGKRIAVERANTAFGTVSFTLQQASDTQAALALQTSFRVAPRQIELHLPWFLQFDHATADGVTLQASGNTIMLPAATRSVQLRWHKRTSAPTMSFAQTVASYKAAYVRRYQHLLSTGEMSPTIDTWRVPEGH